MKSDNVKEQTFLNVNITVTIYLFVCFHHNLLNLIFFNVNLINNKINRFFQLHLFLKIIKKSFNKKTLATNIQTIISINVNYGFLKINDKIFNTVLCTN